MRALRRMAPLVCLLMLLQACSSSVRVPPDAMEEKSHQGDGRFRLELTDHTVYRFTRYTTTDSTLVIQALQEADERYGKAELPITVRRADIEYMTRTGTSWAPVLIIMGVVAVLGIVVVNMIENSFDESD
ncbi:MAG TPA: hypothetical protein VF128_01305 [Gemmatimonadaceae bacterium]